MALDTTIGGASADSYGDLVDFQAYAASMGWTLTASETQQEAYLRRAAVKLDRDWRFKGFRRFETQARAWPRVVDGTDEDGYAIPQDSIPQAIKDAQFELAWIAHGGVDILAAVTTGSVKLERAKVGPIEEEIEYNGSRVRPVYPAVTGLLRGYIAGGPGTARLVRG